MPVVTVKNKYQVVIPAKLRHQVGIKVGDLLDVSVEDGKITFTPKSLVDREIAEGLEDFRRDRTFGPYDTVDEMLIALHRAAKTSRGNPRKRR